MSPEREGLRAGLPCEGPQRAGLLRIATRGSALARWQAEEVARLLRDAHPGIEVELVVVSTMGDLRLDLPVWALGGQGVFVKEVQAAVLGGLADLAVHSAKDLPSSTAPGLSLAAIPPRGDPRDALVGCRLDDLAPGACIATGSVRRRAQLAWLRPDLTFVSLRGNIASRLTKVPAGGAVVVAAAALERLGRQCEAAHLFDPGVMVPQVGQGAIGVECREDDAMTAGALAALDDPGSRRVVSCERAFLAQLSGGCDLPVGAYAVLDDHAVLHAEGLLASGDGRVLLRARMAGSRRDDPARGDDPAAVVEAETLGAALADELLAAGGEALLDVERT